jgi:two-component system, NarL family, nitrate/nitrite response regulator NarL
MITISNSVLERPVSKTLLPSKLPHVLILSDVRLIRESLALLLSRDRVVRVVGTVPATEACTLVAQRHADVALLDAKMEDFAGCARGLRKAASGIKIVAFAVANVDHEFIACAEAGISAFVDCNASRDDLLHAIQQAQRGGFSLSPQQVTVLINRIAVLAEMRHEGPGAANLTPREREIVPLIERGLSNKEIARQLSIETTTAKNHIHNILEKLELNRRGQIGALVRGPQRDGGGIELKALTQLFPARD